MRLLAWIVIGLLIGGGYLYYKQPDTFNNIKGKITGSISSFTKEQPKEPTKTTPEETETQNPPPEQPSITYNIYIENYGKPVLIQNCIRDRDCQRFMPQITDIKCNITSGECYRVKTQEVTP